MKQLPTFLLLVWLAYGAKPTNYGPPSAYYGNLPTTNGPHVPQLLGSFMALAPTYQQPPYYQPPTYQHPSDYQKPPAYQPSSDYHTPRNYQQPPTYKTQSEYQPYQPRGDFQPHQPQSDYQPSPPAYQQVGVATNSALVETLESRQEMEVAMNLALVETLESLQHVGVAINSALVKTVESVAESLAVVLTAVSSVVYPAARAMAELALILLKVVNSVLQPIADVMVVLVLRVLPKVIFGIIGPVVHAVVILFRHISIFQEFLFDVCKTVAEGPLGDVVFELNELLNELGELLMDVVKEVLKNVYTQIVKPTGDIFIEIKDIVEYVLRKVMSETLEPIVKKILTELVVPIAKKVITGIETVVWPLVTNVVLPLVLTAAAAPLVGVNMALSSLETVLVDSLGLPQHVFSRFKQLVLGAIGLSLLWVVPEGILPLPYLLFLGWVGGGQWLVYWLAVMESVLVYRTLPGLLEAVSMTRSWEVEDMDVLEERLQKAIVKYSQD